MADYKKFETLPAGWTMAYYTDGGIIGAEGDLKWSSAKPPPALGESVKVNFNKLGSAVVKGYFAEAGWLGVLLSLSDPPKWWKEQNKSDPKRLAHVFGTELVGWELEKKREAV